MDKKKLRSLDLLTSIIFIIIGLIFIIISINLISLSQIRDKRVYLSNGFVPLLFSLVFIIISINVLLNAVREGGTLSLFLPNKIIAIIKSPEGIRTSFIISWIGIYIFVLMKFLPYAISTFIFLFLFILVFYQKSLIKVFIISISISLALTYMFGSVAQVVLP